MWEQVELERLERHKELADWQQKCAWEDRMELRMNQDRHMCLVFQDFTQVQVQRSFFQDYIMVIYWVNASGQLQHQFFHFLAGSASEHHDDAFVMHVWRHQLRSTLFDS